MGNAPPEFTDEDIIKIATSLPETVDPRRRALLASILPDWSSTDLRDHFSMDTPAFIRERRKRHKRVARRATDLAHALDTLDETDRNLVAFEMAAPGDSSSSAGKTGVEELRRRIGEERDFLVRFSTAAQKATGKPRRGQPRNVVAFLVMQDLAAIYEFIARRKATRTREEAGPFWDFAAAVWPVVFGRGDDGLGAAMKNWASARAKYAAQSPYVINLILSIRNIHMEDIP